MNNAEEIHFRSVAEYNDKCIQAGLVDVYVANTDKAPVRRFFEDVGLEDKDILDIGCADGTIAAEAAGLGENWHSYTGVDLNEGYVTAFNNKRVPNSTVEIGNVIDLENHKDASKDILLLLFIHQHLSEKHGMIAIQELWRVAKPNGEILIGLTVHTEKSTERKSYVNPDLARNGAEPILTTIWNKAAFLDVLKQQGLEVVWQVEVQFDLPRGDLCKLYVRARKAAIT